jgi:small subunit ribosomal protein S11
MADEEKKPAPASQAAPAAAQAAPASRPQTGGSAKKSWKGLTYAKVYIQCSFNNTIVSLTDDRGDVLAWASAGGSGFRGTKKGTPFAAGVTATKIAKRALEMGVKQIAVFIKGPGPGRETAVRSLGNAGLIIISLKDVTPLPHNGCRPPKARRV